MHEMGLNVTKFLDDFAEADPIAKDGGGPLFLSRETESTFTLTSHLKGYRTENVKMDINKDGTVIAIIGEKPVQELVMFGGKVYKKEMEMRGFKKAFKIPVGVILDKITAKFKEDESILTITMPKSVKGISGIIIEEVKGEALVKQGSGSLQIVGDEVTEKEKWKQDDYDDEALPPKKIPEGNEKEQGYGNLDPRKIEPNGSKAPYQEETQVEEVHDLKEQINTEEQEVKSGKKERVRVQELDQAESSRIKQPIDQDECNDNHVVRGKEVYGRENEIQEKVNDVEEARKGEFSREKEYPGDKPTQTEKIPEKKSRICVPALAGSALLISLIVFVIHVVRDKSKRSKNQ